MSIVEDLGFWKEVIFDEKDVDSKKTLKKGIDANSVVITGDIKKIDLGAFANCKKLDVLSMEEGVAHIGHGAFYMCKKLANIEFADSIEVIDEYAFSGCQTLKSIVLPFNLREINRGGFSDCIKLENVTFSNNITKIGGYAFAGCKKIKEIKLPSSVTTIEKMAFSQTSISSINLPKSLKLLGRDVFINSKLKTVYYEGTEEEWNEIKNLDINEHLANCKIIFNHSS